MTITGVVTNHNYARYLPRCLESALEFCDEVLVYDDGSTDESLDVIERFRVDLLRCRESASGDGIWGSDLGIADATSTHLVFIDADNYLVRRPPTTDRDYLFAAIAVAEGDAEPRYTWQYPQWPLDAQTCLDEFPERVRAVKRPLMPFPWGGVWRTSFLAGKRWRRFESTSFGYDLRTALDWCGDLPTLAYDPEPFLVFRKHAGQWSASPERDLMMSELRATVMGG